MREQQTHFEIKTREETEKQLEKQMCDALELGVQGENVLIDLISM